MTQKNDRLELFEQLLNEEFVDEEIGAVIGDNPFHLVGSLFSSDSINVTSVSPDDSIRDALKLMLNNGYSQLPVMDSKRYRGLVSIKSIVQVLHDLASTRSGPIRIDFDSIRVAEAMDPKVPAISPEENIYDLIELLKAHEALIMGNLKTVQAVITPFDVINRIWNIAGPYILCQEIELALRQIIRKIIPETPQFKDFIHRHPSKQENGRQIETLEDMTLGELSSMILSNSYWSKFQPILGNKSFLKARFDELSKLRNRVMHHSNRVLKLKEYDSMLRFRNLLLDKIQTLDDLYD